MSTFSPNLDLELVARGADIGVWDTPTNNNWGIVDSVVGGITTISLNNSGVILNAAQFQSRQLTFNSTLTGNCIITFPTSFTKSYEVQNLCTGSSANTITLETTASGGQVICCPPGEIIDVVNDGINLKYKNFGRIGSYWDFCGSSVPNWVTGCTVPPWLNCDASTISSATYPVLVTYLGTTTLPDLRGVSGATLNQGTNRITTAGSGLDGNTRFSVGGSQSLQTHNHTATTGGMSANAAHGHTANGATIGIVFGGGGPGQAWAQAGALSGATFNTDQTNTDHTHAVTVANAGSGGSQNMPPTTITGICMIRAA